MLSLTLALAADWSFVKTYLKTTFLSLHNVVKNKAGHFEKVKVDEREAAAGKVDRPSKLIGKIRKSFEDIKAPVSRKVAAENMPFPDPPSEQELRESCSNSVAGSAAPVTPPRSSSFHKAGGSRLSLRKTSPKSKSASSRYEDENSLGTLAKKQER